MRVSGSIDFGVLEGTRFKDEEGRILSKDMEAFFEAPMSYARPENGENISDILARTGISGRSL